MIKSLIAAQEGIGFGATWGPLDLYFLGLGLEVWGLRVSSHEVGITMPCTGINIALWLLDLLTCQVLQLREAQRRGVALPPAATAGWVAFAVSSKCQELGGSELHARVQLCETLV